MKKYFFIILLTMPITSFSQRFYGGPVIGLNATQIDGDELAGYNKGGLVAGVFVTTEFTRKFGAEMELYYSAKGSSTSKDDNDHLKYKLQYIELPLSAYYKVIKNIRLQLGLSLGYLFSAKKNLYDGNGEQNILPSLKKTDMEGFGGITYTYFDPLMLKIQYSYSLFPIFEPDPGQIPAYRNWYNNVITIGICYRIGKKR